MPHQIEVRGKSGQKYYTIDYATRAEAESALDQMITSTDKFVRSPCGNFALERAEIEGMQINSFGEDASETSISWNPIRGEDEY